MSNSIASDPIGSCFLDTQGIKLSVLETEIEAAEDCAYDTLKIEWLPRGATTPEAEVMCGQINSRHFLVEPGKVSRLCMVLCKSLLCFRICKFNTKRQTSVLSAKAALSYTSPTRGLHKDDGRVTFLARSAFNRAAYFAENHKSPDSRSETEMNPGKIFSNPQVVIKFTSDSSETARGFKVEYEAEMGGGQPDPCEGDGVILRQNRGSIASPGYDQEPYPDSTRCVWNIEAPPGKVRRHQQPYFTNNIVLLVRKCCLVRALSPVNPMAQDSRIYRSAKSTCIFFIWLTVH